MKLSQFISSILVIVMLFSVNVFADGGSITITTSSPWFEGGYVEWSDSTGASDYNVYYKLSTASEYIKIDDELVRGTRADILGLPGEKTYDIKVTPIIGGIESEALSAVTQITPMVYDRSGFAFSSKSPHKNTTGGYNLDGSVKSDAVILYVSEETKNTVTCDVTKNNTTETYTGLGNILQARESAKSTVPLIVRFIGTVTPMEGVDSASLLNIKATQNVTVEGIGEDTLIYGWGFNIRNAQNIEVRNLAFEQFPDDSVSMQVDNCNIWVHNNDFHIGKNGGGDKSKGDGSCDVKDDSTYVTISYNNFESTGKSSLCGMKSETAGVGFVTYHHNWFNKSGSRHPRIRTITVHAYNNYYDHCYSGGVAATTGSSAFLEANYFEDVVRPYFMAGQGNDIKEDGDSFSSGENGGVIKSFNNLLTTCGGSVTYLGSDLEYVTKECKGCTYYNPAAKTVDASVAAQYWPDAYLADTRDEIVPSTFYAYKGGATYNNFDTSPDMYSYTPDTPEEAKAKAISYAGRVKNLDPSLPLSAPTNCSAAINDDGSIILKWDAVLGASYYNVSYSVDEALVESNIRVDSVSYTIPGLTLKENQKISFTVSAVKEDGSIGTSGSGSASYTAPAAPTNLTLETGNAKITALWKAVTGASSYKVSISDGTSSKDAFTTDTSYTFDNLKGNVTYTVSVKAVTGALESAAVTASAKSVAYISESGMDCIAIDDDFDTLTPDGVSEDLASYSAVLSNSADSSLKVVSSTLSSSDDYKLYISDNSTTGSISVSRSIIPIKDGRFSASFDITFGEKPNGINNLFTLTSGDEIVVSVSINSQKLYANSGAAATVSGGSPQGTTTLLNSTKITSGQTISFKIVGDIDNKVFDLYSISGQNEPDLKSSTLVLGSNFASTGIDKLTFNTSASKAHNFYIDNVKVCGTNIEGAGLEQLSAPTNPSVTFNENNNAVLSWDSVDKATSYTVVYSIDGTEISDSVASSLTSTSYTVPAQLYNGNKVSFTVQANANGYRTSAKASASNTITIIVSGVYGDVDGDSLITLSDAAAVLTYVKNASGNIDVNLADVNGDKVVSALDAAYIFEKVLNSSFVLPIEAAK